MPLDDTRQWYRYHQLFADVLRLHLLAEQGPVRWRPCTAAPASGTAGRDAQDAIRHALAGEDFVGAARLIELAVPELRRSRQEAQMLRWFGALPDAVTRCRPVLCAHMAGALLLTGQVDAAAARLADAEQWLGAEAASGTTCGMVVEEEEEFRRLPGWISIFHAGIALARGDVAATVEYARQAHDRMLAEDHLGRGAAAGFLGLAAWTTGDLATAYKAYVECIDGMQRAGFLADALGGALTMAEICVEQGRLHDAMHHYAWGLQLADEAGQPALRGTADMHVGMSELYREFNDLPAARQHLLAGEELGEFAGLPQSRYRRRVAMARLCAAEGDLDGGVLALLDAAERLYVADFTPNVHPMAAMKARLWVCQGRLAEAWAWASEQGLSATDEPSYRREYEHITLAKVLMARYESDGEERALLAASGLLGRLRQAAEAGGRMGSVLEILLLEARGANCWATGRQR